MKELRSAHDIVHEQQLTFKYREKSHKGFALIIMKRNNSYKETLMCSRVDIDDIMQFWNHL